MKSFLNSLFSDGKGTISSKRVAGLLCVISLVMVFFINTLSKGSMNPSDSLIDVIGLLAFGCLGLTSTEAIFGRKSNDKSKDQSAE